MLSHWNCRLSISGCTAGSAGAGNEKPSNMLVALLLLLLPVSKSIDRLWCRMAFLVLLFRWVISSSSAFLMTYRIWWEFCPATGRGCIDGYISNLRRIRYGKKTAGRCKPSQGKGKSKQARVSLSRDRGRHQGKVKKGKVKKGKVKKGASRSQTRPVRCESLLCWLRLPWIPAAANGQTKWALGCVPLSSAVE